MVARLRPPAVSNRHSMKPTNSQPATSMRASRTEWPLGEELEVSFERFMASLYMTAMMQLGLMVEQGGSPQVDLIALADD